MFGPKIIHETTEKIRVLEKKIKATQSKQKAFADQHRKPLEFLVRDKVFQKVSPMKKMVRVGKKNKLDSRYVGQFEIRDIIGPVSHPFALPPDLERIHDVFYVPQLKIYIPNPGHVILYQPLQI